MPELQQNTLSRLLSRFSPSELEEMERYAVFARKGDNILAPLRLYSSGIFETMSKAEFFTACKGEDGLSFTDNRFRLLLHRVKEFVFEFMAVSEVRNSTLKQHQGALRVAGQRQWDEEVISLHRRIDREADKSPESMELLVARFDWEEALQEATIRRGDPDTGQHPGHFWTYFEDAYLAQALRYQSIAIDFQMAHATNSELVAIPESYLQSLLAQRPNHNSELITAYKAIWEVLRAPKDPAPFHKADKLIRSLIERQAVKRESLGEMVLLIFNQAYRLAREELVPWQVVTDLQILQLDFLKGSIHPRQLKNVIGYLCFAGEVSVAKEILDRFAERIQGDPEGHALLYNRGVTLFYEGEFGAAKKVFREIIYAGDDNYFKSDGRMYLWRSAIADCLGGGDFDHHFLDYEGEKSRQFFRRSKQFSDRSRAFYQTYFKTFRSLYRLLGMNPRQRKEKIIDLWKEVSQFREHPLRNWLFEQLKRVEQYA